MILIGKAYEALCQIKIPKIQEFLQINFPYRVVPLESECNINYQLLKDLLINQQFKDADTVTRQKLLNWQERHQLSVNRFILLKLNNSLLLICILLILCDGFIQKEDLASQYSGNFDYIQEKILLNYVQKLAVKNIIIRHFIPMSLLGI
ncbi:hypothetical protein ETSB_1652 [cyanobacterium endosymbiont of Epithemia turgida isolate EtSB Lake Yunoko]|nr:hypothetical protein ETSB_1652 [cyanobacterium endosymbiont of Epithemia turgida isolate EtSB Lake Yunoko]